MLLVIDAGNTNITFGVYKEKKLVTTFRLTTMLARTSDEFGASIIQLLGMNGITKEESREFTRQQFSAWFRKLNRECQ